MEEPQPRPGETPTTSIAPQRALLWTLALLASLAFLLFSWLQGRQAEPETGYDPDAAPLVLLDPLLRGADGRYAPLLPPLPQSGTLVFQIRLSRPGSAALLWRQGDQPPRKLSEAHALPPGRAVLLPNNDAPLQHNFGADIGQFRFCVITASSPEGLEYKVGQATLLWDSLPWRACTHFTESE